MQQINELINYFKNIDEEKIVDILIAVIIITVFSVFSSILSYIIIKLFIKKEHRNKEYIKSNGFYLPIKILIVFIGLYIGIYIIQLPEAIMNFWKRIFEIVVICIVAKGLINVVDPKSDIAKSLRKKDASNEDKTVANFTGRILKYIIYIIAAFLILAKLNFDISGIIAGLGIGGAVVALAAQDFVKGLISGMSILSDKPFLVGDWIEVGQEQGTVLDISFRCTKIRTSNNTIVTLPNSIITSTSVINWSRVKQRRYDINLKLPLETNSEVIETIVNRIRFVLQTNKEIVPDTIQVNFNTIDQFGINIYVYVYTYITDYANYLAFRQQINEQILKILESEDVKLAYPGQNIYMLDENKKDENK